MPDTFKTFAEMCAYLETGDKPTEQQFRDILYTLTNGGVVPPATKEYTVLLDQAAPETITSGTLRKGAIYTLTTFVAGDDFSNMELLSGTVNTTGSTFRAISDTPTVFTNSSTLDYAGEPYVVSTDADDEVNPFVNTLSDVPVWSYISAGYFALTLAGEFPENKVFIFPVEAVPPVAGRTYLAETIWWDADSIRLKTVRIVDGTTKTATDVCLFKTAFKIIVFP